MDPDACFSALLEQISHQEWDDAGESAESLQQWLRNGGFGAPPSTPPCCQFFQRRISLALAIETLFRAASNASKRDSV